MSKPSKQERRRRRLEAEDERQRLETIRTPRHPHDHMSFTGAGTLIVQLLIWEPRRQCESWNIRLLADSTVAGGLLFPFWSWWSTSGRSATLTIGTCGWTHREAKPTLTRGHTYLA